MLSIVRRPRRNFAETFRLGVGNGPFVTTQTSPAGSGTACRLLTTIGRRIIQKDSTCKKNARKYDIVSKWVKLRVSLLPIADSPFIPDHDGPRGTSTVLYLASAWQLRVRRTYLACFVRLLSYHVSIGSGTVMSSR